MGLSARQGLALPVGALVLVLLAGTPARADAVLDRLRTEAAKAGVRGFERTTRKAKTTPKGPVTDVRVDRFDPRAAAGRQWTLLSVNGRPPTPTDQGEHRKLVSSLRVPGFYRLSAILAGEPERRTDTSAPFGRGVRQTSETKFRPL